MAHFVKSHSLGNDYLVIDPTALPFGLTPARVRLICDRHRGIGSDGIVALEPRDGPDFGVRIYNPDGSEAEKSGNGVRIFAKFLREHGYTDRPRFVVHTAGGPVDVSVADDTIVEADMGEVTVGAPAILDVDGARLDVTPVSLGNPHCVVVVPDLGRVEVRALGPTLERHPAFPRGTNVQFVQVIARDRVDIRIWERGAGETLASGTSSCAVVAACERRGLVAREVRVAMPGGVLDVRLDAAAHVHLRGPVQEIAVGDLSSDLLGQLQALA